MEISGHTNQMPIPGLCVEASRAKTSHLQAKEQVCLVSGQVCGGKCTASSMNPDLIGCLLKTFLLLGLEDLTTFSYRWKKSATPQNRSWWVLCMSELHNQGKESGLWATPTASLNAPAAWKDGIPWWKQSRSARNLHAQTLWATPTASQYGNNQGGAQGRIGKKRFSLPYQVANNTNGKPQDLNPDWVEQLMGYPVGWTNIE